MKLNEIMMQVFIIVSLLILNVSLMFQAEKLLSIKNRIQDEIYYKTYLVSGMEKICFDKNYLLAIESNENGNTSGASWNVLKEKWETQCKSLFNLDYLELEKTENGFLQKWKKDGKEYACFLEEKK